MARTLFLDIETYSDIDLRRTGPHRYAASDETRITVCAYAFGNDPIQVWSYQERIPDDLYAAVPDVNVVKWAHNAEFERTVFAKWYSLPKGTLDPRSWRCSSVLARSLGLPGGLPRLAPELGVVEKLEAGQRLMRKFCWPPGRPNHEDPEWKLFLDYCARDVEAMRAALRLMLRAPVL